MTEAARVHDRIEHSWGIIGLIVGAIVCAVVCALILTSMAFGVGFIIAAIALGAASMAVEWGAEYLASLISTPVGEIKGHAETVKIEGQWAARAKDNVDCGGLPLMPWRHDTKQIAQGSKTVSIEKQAAARVDDKTTCSATIGEGAQTVFIGGPTGTYLVIEDEIPSWLRWAVVGLTLLPGLARGLFQLIRGAGRLVLSVGPRIGSFVSGFLRTSVQGLKNSWRGLKDLSRRLLGDPVDVVTGAVIDFRTDIEQSGPLPFVYKRYYNSNQQHRSHLGEEWLDNWSHHLSFEGEICTYYNDDGMGVYFHVPYGRCEAENFSEPRYLLRVEGSNCILIDHDVQCHYHFVRTSASGQALECNQQIADGEANGIALLQRVTDAHGNELVCVRNDNGELEKVVHSSGEQFLFKQAYTKSGDQRLVGIDHRLASGETRNLVTYHYDNVYRLKQVQTLAHGQYNYHYHNEGAGRGKLAGWSDANKTKAQFTYDVSGRCIQVTTATGHHSAQFSYDDERRVTTVKNALGQSSFYHYNDALQLTRIVDELGYVTQYLYDEDGHQDGIIDPNGHYTQTDYVDGNPIQVTRPDGHKVSLQWNEQRLLTGITDAEGQEWQREYDEHGMLVAELAPDGGKNRYRYNPRGQLVSLTNAAHQSQQYDYDAQHRLSRIIDVQGRITQFAYDQWHRLITTTQPNGSQERYTYDAHDRLTTVSQPDAQGQQQTLHYAYDIEGNVSAVTDAEGHEQTFDYDAFDLLTQAKDVQNNRTQFRYDKEGRVIAVVNASGAEWTYQYDAAGRLVGETPFTGISTDYAYDAAGQCVAKRVGHKTRQSASHAGTQTNEQSAIVLQEGLVTHYQYDVLGNLIEQSAPEGRTQFSYTANGHLHTAEVKQKDYQHRLAFERDVCGRVLQQQQDDYELAYQYNPAGQRVQRQTPHGQVSYAYHYTGHLKHLQLHNASGHMLDQLDFTFNDNGFETQRAGQHGFTHYQHTDDFGRLLWQVAGDQQLRSLVKAADLPQLMPGKTVVNRQYQYDVHANPTRIQDQRWGINDYTYNNNQQIIQAHLNQDQAQTDTTNEQYQYNATQDIVSSQIKIDTAPLFGASTSAAAASNSASAQLLNNDGWHYQSGGRVERTPTHHYDYDGYGRVISKTQYRDGYSPQTTKYRWDSQNQLIGIQTPRGEQWQYQYDALGRRIQKHNGTKGVYTLWDGDVIAEQIALGAEQQPVTDFASHPQARRPELWLYEPDSHVPLAKCVAGEQADAEQLYYVVNDHMGTPKELLTPDGRLAWSATYNTWGQMIGQYSPPEYHIEPERRDQYRPYHQDWHPQADCDIRFQGQQYDAESGLHYNRFRYYDPDAASYLSSDPIGLSGGFRSYGYVANPLGRVDPLGLAGCSTTLGRNMLEAMEDLTPRYLMRWVGYQAHHILPCQIANHPALRAIGYNIDEAANGIFLRRANGGISGMSRHQGSHNGYTDAVKAALDRIDLSQATDVIARQIAEVQNLARRNLQNGLPIRGKDMARESAVGNIKVNDLWTRVFNGLSF